MWDLMPDFKQRSTRPQSTFARPEGQTLVEFALITVLFLMLLFGITEFSRALWTWNAIVHATREGARYAVVQAPTSTDAEIIKYVVYHDPAGTASSAPVVPGLSESNVTVTYLKYDGTTVGSTVSAKTGADVIQVRIVGYTFNFLVPFFGSGLTLPAFTTTLPLEGLGAS